MDRWISNLASIYILIEVLPVRPCMLFMDSACSFCMRRPNLYAQRFATGILHCTVCTQDWNFCNVQYVLKIETFVRSSRNNFLKVSKVSLLAFAWPSKVFNVLPFAWLQKLFLSPCKKFPHAISYYCNFIEIASGIAFAFANTVGLNFWNHKNVKILGPSFNFSLSSQPPISSWSALVRRSL